MRLYTAKTVVIPCKLCSVPTDPHRKKLEQLGFKVVSYSGHTKFLGIYYGPRLSDADRIQRMLADLQ